MRILIFGGTGMLGHKLYQTCRETFDTWVCLRGSGRKYSKMNIFEQSKVVKHADILDSGNISRILLDLQPDAVVNCAGVVRQIAEASGPICCIRTNSLFPHFLARLCGRISARMIHISTDCVFSGRKGSYTEDDLPDPSELYGRSKLLGEVALPRCLTLRTSFIGRQLNGDYGLVEWLLRNRDRTVKGHTRAIFSGFTTLALARLIVQILEKYPVLEGIHHVSSDPISKHDLLCLLTKALGTRTEIVPDGEMVVDRSLDSSRFRSLTGFVPPLWSDMVSEMAEDPTPYDSWRNCAP